MNTCLSRFSLTSLSLAVALASQTSFANDKLEEIIVTGELRDANALSVANSVSIVNASTLAARNTQHLEDVFNLAPNVNYSTGASRGRFILIRGIGERSQFVDPVNPSVGVMLDGIDMTGISTGITALDTKQVEIFRGPQGTLFGANALAGLVNVVSNDVSDEPSGKISAGFGTYGAFDAGLTLSSPINDVTGWRAAVKQTNSDGFIENTHLDRKDTNNIDEFSAKNLLTFDFGKSLAMRWVTYYIDVDNGYDAFSLDNNRKTLSDEPGHDRQTTLATALHTTYSGSDMVDLEVIASVAESEIEYGYDEDWAYRDICPIDSECAGGQYSTTDNYERDNSNTALDVRLISKGDSKFAWVAGAYVRNQDVELARTRVNNDSTYDFYSLPRVPEVTPYASDYTTNNSALYGEVRSTLSATTTLVTGLRLERISSDFIDSNGSTFNPGETLWGGKMALEVQISDHEMVYGLISRGYKGNGFNTEVDLEEEDKTFDTETMVNFELGTKGQWLDKSLTGQFALFYQLRNDIQVKQSTAYEADGTIEFTDSINNAAEGVNYGAEMELLWSPVESITLFSNVGLLQTSFKKFSNTSHVDGTVDMDGRDQPHAPNYQYSTGATFQFGDLLSARFEIEGKDDFYFSANHEEKAAAYTLLNARIAFQLDEIEFALWAKNLTDATVETRGFYFSHDFGNDPRKFYAAEPYSQKGAPRTVGVSASLSF